MPIFKKNAIFGDAQEAEKVPKSERGVCLNE
jgi:hypothetical protein